MIYIVKANEEVKIGHSANPSLRIMDLQVSNSIKLEVLLIIDGGFDTEQSLHKEFLPYKTRGEWYRYSQSIKDFIQSNIEDDRRYEFGFIDSGPSNKEQVRRLRKAAGLNLSDFSNRLGITPQSAKEIQDRELNGSITLKSLEKAFEALDCKLEYRAVPNKIEDRIYKELGTPIELNHLPVGVYYIRDNGRSLKEIHYHRVNQDLVLDVLDSIDCIELTDLIIPILESVTLGGVRLYDASRMIAKHILNSRGR